MAGAAERKQLDPQTVRFIGRDKVGGATFSYTVTIAVCKDLPAACWTTSWTVDKDVDDWQVYFAYHQQFQHDWRVQSYPWAGNTEGIDLGGCDIAACPACWSIDRTNPWWPCSPSTATRII